MSRFLSLCLLILALLPALGVVPALLEPADNATNLDIPVTLRWQIGAGTAYECHVTRDDKFTDSALVETKVTGATLTLTHLLPGVTYYWRVRAAKDKEWSAARSFTTSEAVPAASRNGRVVTVLSSQTGPGTHIYIMNADASAMVQLTNQEWPMHPALSPDGRQMVFTTMGKEGVYGTGGLWVMQADGSGCRQLPVPAGRIWLPGFSPDGKVIYFALGENLGADWHLALINTDGTGFMRLPIVANMQAEPALSEDGATFVTLASRKATLYDSATYEQTATLTNIQPFQLQEPCFTRDGSSVLATAYADGRMKLMQIFTDDSGDACLATRDRVFSPCMSPDGSIILYGGEKGLSRILPDGKDVPITSTLDEVYMHLRWQAAPGRWTPGPTAMTVPADKAAAVPIPTTLAWTPMPGVTGYAIQVALEPTFQDPEVAYTQVYGAKVQLAALKPGTTYFWRVRSVFRNEQGAWSAPRAFTTGKAGPQGFGRVNGIVTFEGGGPLAKVRVTVTIGTKATVFTTDEDGTFAGSVPAGAGTAAAEGTQVALTVKAGVETNIALVQKPDTGVVLTATMTDGTPFTGRPSGACRHPEPGEENDRTRYNQLMPLNPRVVGPGVFWFPTVRAEDTEFAVNSWLQGSHLHGSIVHRWKLEQGQAVRRLTMTVPSPVHVVITLRDENGNPLRNTRVEGRISRRFLDPYNFWPDSHRENSLSDTSITMGKPERFTDDEGRLDLANMVVNTYSLALTTEGWEGKRVQLVVGEDGTYTPMTISLQPLRTVRQTVFQPDGKPAADAEVFASFMLGGSVTILRGRTDARGQVTWIELPHRRVIVSGETVAAGVIPPEGDAFTVPLPAPVPERKVEFHAELRVDGVVPVRFGAMLQTPDGCQLGGGEERLSQKITGVVMPASWILRTGVPFTYCWGANFSPVEARLLAGAYLPYVDEGVEVTHLPIDDFPVTEYTGVAVKGRLISKTGNPVPDKTLIIMPAAGNRLYDILTAGKAEWLLGVRTDAAGRFTVSLPQTGDYSIGVGDKILKTIAVPTEPQQEDIIVTMP